MVIKMLENNPGLHLAPSMAWKDVSKHRLILIIHAYLTSYGDSQAKAFLFLFPSQKGWDSSPGRWEEGHNKSCFMTDSPSYKQRL